MAVALVRAPSLRLGECKLTHVEREPIDVAVARAQHEAYCQALRGCSCLVRDLPGLPEHPDGVFVEDAAVVLDEVAVLTRPGAASRRGEADTVEAALRGYRPVERIDAGALDGGDVLRVGRDLLVGLSARTDQAGVEQLRARVVAHGYAVHAIPVTGVLHFKSACTAAAPDLLVVNRAWIDEQALRDALPATRLLDVDPTEPRGANHLLVGTTLLSPASCPRTVDRLREAGLHVEIIDVSELEKAEAGVTCSSLIFDP